MSKFTSKLVAGAVALALALTISGGASTAGAQAMTLSQLVDLFISLGIISPDKAAAAKSAVTSTATVPATTYTRDLTIGATGADVTALQTALGVTPATGYFGSITAAAVKAYQTSKGISATGYFGPLTRASMSGSATTVVTTTPGTTTPVVNTGVEGTLTVDRASISNSTVYEGARMQSVLGLRLQARLSDITVQRVRLNLGADTTVYTRSFNTMYIVDDSGKTLAQAALNSNTVVKDGTNYILTFAGFNYVVPQNTTKYLWVKADAAGAFRTSGTGNCASTEVSCSISLAADGVRGIDSAGFDQFGGGSTGFSQTLTLQTSLIDSASLDLSVSSTNFKTTSVVADQGSNNDELDALSLLAFDLRANKDQVEVTDITVSLTRTGSTATTTTAYLYEGSTLLATESVSSTNNTVVFADLQNVVIAKDTTKTLTVKVDVRDAQTAVTNFTASVTAVRGENSQGLTVNGSGTPAGEAMAVLTAGPVFTINSISTGSVSRATDTVATSTVAYTFNLGITAKGADITFGASGSAYALASSTGLNLYRNEAIVSVPAGMLVNTFYGIPSSGVTTLAGSTGFKLSKNNSVTIPVIVELQAASSTTQGSYSVGIKALAWGKDYAATTTSTFMNGESAWKSTNVTLP